MKFNKISVIDNCGLTFPELDKIIELSNEQVSIYSDFPLSEKEIIQRISDSDCVLVSWHTNISAEIIRACPSVQFIGMCCSLYDENSANVDISESRKRGIEVQGVRDYGDEGAVEFIFAQLIFLLKGLGKHRWRHEATELKNKTIGIIGFGSLGQMVAKTAYHFGMEVFYYSRTRKPNLEGPNLTYLPLDQLLINCEIITTHLPKNTTLLHRREFKILKKNAILINTSLGLTFDKDAFIQWLLGDKTSFAILDGDGMGNFHDEFTQVENVIMSEQFAGFTLEAKKRLSEKVLLYLINYLSQK
ncbi:MAG: NAD(P)-dependent oxidoreductase [Saprospiraceae bacterium]